jgi:DnaJ-class molecular chaperone
MPILGEEDEKGDLYVKVNIEVPKRLSKKEKRLWEELENIS